MADTSVNTATEDKTKPSNIMNADNTKRLSRERSKLSEKFICRANTMLRSAKLSRESKRSTTRPESGVISAMVGSLEKEKTMLEATLEDDEEMELFMLEMKKQSLQKAKEFTDSDFDTDLEDEIGIEVLLNIKLYFKTFCIFNGIKKNHTTLISIKKSFK